MYVRVDIDRIALYIIWSQCFILIRNETEHVKYGFSFNNAAGSFYYRIGIVSRFLQYCPKRQLCWGFCNVQIKGMCNELIKRQIKMTDDCLFFIVGYDFAVVEEVRNTMRARGSAVAVCMVSLICVSTQ